MKALHDLGKHNAKGLGWWFIIASEPATTCARIDAHEMGKVGFGFLGPRELRQITEANSLAVDMSDGPLDNSVQAARRFAKCVRIRSAPPRR